MASITYNALEKDSEVVEMLGYRFFNGVPVEVTNPDHVKKFKGNRHFDVADGEIFGIKVAPDPIKRGPGRPPKAIEAPVEEPVAPDVPAEQEAGG
jgi:hypothetical protein